MRAEMQQRDGERSIGRKSFVENEQHHGPSGLISCRSKYDTGLHSPLDYNMFFENLFEKERQCPRPAPDGKSLNFSCVVEGEFALPYGRPGILLRESNEDQFTVFRPGPRLAEMDTLFSSSRPTAYCFGDYVCTVKDA